MKNKEAFEVLQIIFPRGFDLDARLVEAVQKHLKHSQQQLLERLSEGMKKQKEAETRDLQQEDGTRKEWESMWVEGFDTAIEKLEALIQEEKERL